MGNLSAKTLPIVDWASASDIPDLIAVWWDSFNDDFIRRIYPQTPDGRQWLERAFAKNLAPRTDPDIPATEVIIVRDPDTGLPAAVAVYRIIPEGSDAARRSWRARWPALGDLPDIREDVWTEFYDPMEKTQAYLLGSRGHVYLEALGTMAQHRKKGYGTALVQYGNDLADKLGVECYLDASDMGRPVYEANGYVVQDTSAVVEKRAGVSMVRPRTRKD